MSLYKVSWSTKSHPSAVVVYNSCSCSCTPGTAWRCLADGPVLPDGSWTNQINRYHVREVPVV